MSVAISMMSMFMSVHVRTKARSLFLAALITLSTLSVAGTMHAAAAGSGAGSWVIDTVDNGKLVEGDTSLALDASGSPHISYRDSSTLRYAYKDASGWNSIPVDDYVDGKTSLALDKMGNPHISYYNKLNKDLWYAYKDASGWHSKFVDHVGAVWTDCSIALDASGNPHISYYDFTNFDLSASGMKIKYAYRVEAGWDISTVDSGNVMGGGTSLALDASGNPHISYYEITNGLKYAYKDTSGWHTSTVDSKGTGQFSSLALDASGSPRISYCDETNNALKYAYPALHPVPHLQGYAVHAKRWQIETVDSAGDKEGYRYTSLALDKMGNPHISYCHFAKYNLKYAYKDASGWHTEIVGNKESGWDNSLALSTSGEPRISYFDGGHAIKLASKIIVK